jgi:LysR family transcriptional activator of nhaA
MAMLRLLARAARAAAVVPTVVVRDELREGRLEEYCQLPNLFESFFAISIKRHYQHPLLKTLLGRKEKDLLAAQPPRKPS